MSKPTRSCSLTPDAAGVLQDTPVASVDLDVATRNIARMQAYCDEHGLACRPHVKTHKLPLLAHEQVRAGAVGITCQKLEEAFVMARAGLGDILVAYPLVGPVKTGRLAQLARLATVTVAADSAEVARGLSSALADHGQQISFLVECDTGLGRTGVQDAGGALELARLVDSLPGLRLGGLMTYPTSAASGPFFEAAVAALRDAGLEAPVVSGGGTETAFSTHETPVITELRPGTYVYGDRACVANGTHRLEDCALRIRTTVVSRPAPGRAILDAGSKVLTSDPVEAAGETGYGHILERPNAVVAELFEEHARVDLAASDEPLELGDIVTIVPNHACGTTNMQGDVLLHRSGVLIGLAPVAARGMVR